MSPQGSSSSSGSTSRSGGGKGARRKGSSGPSRSGGGKGGPRGSSGPKGSGGRSSSGSKGSGGRGSSGPKGSSGRGSSGRKGSGGRSSSGRKGSGGRGSSGSKRSGDRTSSPRPPTGRAAAWGSLARKGAQRASEPEDDRPPRPPREPLTDEEQARRDEREVRRAARDANRERLRGEAKDAVDRADTKRSGGRRRRTTTSRGALPRVPLALDEPEVTIARLVAADRAPRYVKALSGASQAFAQERYHDARRTLAPALNAVPDVAEVAELQGLIQYRLGNWKAAADQLERFRTITGTTEQHPVLADCYRALQRYGDVDELWDELRAASPSSDLVTEGRIVAAGALADQGDLTGAVALLEKGWTPPKRPKAHHLRRAYALADLYERNGRAPRARELFRWIQSKDADFGDVGRRVAAL